MLYEDEIIEENLTFEELKNTIINKEAFLKSKTGEKIPVIINCTVEEVNNLKYVILNFTDISKRIRIEENIKGLNNSILKLLSFQNVKAMYRFVGEQLHKFLPSAIILVHSYDKYDSSFELEEIFGLDEEGTSNALNILNTHSKNLKFKLDQDSKNYFIEGKLVKYDGDFVKISRHYLDPVKAQKLQDIFAIKHIYLMGVVTNAELEIAVQIYSRQETDINNAYFVETLLYQTSIAINRKHLEKELIAATFKAKEANEAKSRFLATMSHEIRTPLNSIIGFIDLLSLKIEDKILQSYIKNIRTNSEILLNLINDILDLSKIEAGKTELYVTETPIKKIVNELKQNFEYPCIQKGLGFELMLSTQVPDFIFLDEIKIKQILNNLISNAIKFTDKGKICIHLEAEILENSNCDLLIKVIDTGIGIKQNDLKKILQPFQQQENQDNRKFGGTGLGLSIVHSFVELMKGEITIQSEENKGSVFIIRLKNLKYNLQSVKKDKFDDLKIQTEILEKINILVFNPKSVNINELEDFLFNNNISTTKIIDYEKISGQLKPLSFNVILYIENSSEIDEIRNITHRIKSQSQHSFNVFLLNKTNVILMKSQLMQIGIQSQFSLEMNPKILFRQMFEMLITSTQNIPVSHQLENKNLSQAIQILKQEMLPKCELFKTNQPMKEVEKFANQLIQIGEINNITEIQIYGERLFQQVNQFDIENMRIQLRLFPQFIENLELNIQNQ